MAAVSQGFALHLSLQERHSSHSPLALCGLLEWNDLEGAGEKKDAYIRFSYRPKILAGTIENFDFAKYFRGTWGKYWANFKTPPGICIRA